MKGLIRAIPDSYVRATRADPDPPAIDVAVAREQHAAYARTLRALGVELTVLPASEAHPDCVFVEDTAVVARGRAVVTRSANPVRMGEHDAVAPALAALGLEVVPLREGTCDGGDVLRVGATLYVGRSARTDPAGIAALRDAFRPVGVDVREIDVPAPWLHLKCVATAPAEDMVVVADGTVDPRVFGPVRIVRVPEDEAYAANVLGIGRTVVVARGFPGAARALEAAGFEVLPLATTEIRKGDGALTCLSLLVSGG